MTTREAAPRVSPALRGDAIVALREAMDLKAKDLATVLGIARKTLYCWEADGFFHVHHHIAAQLLAWLMERSEAELLTIASELRRRLARDDQFLVVSWVYSLPVSGEWRARRAS